MFQTTNQYNDTNYCQQPTTDFFWFDGDAIFTKDMVLTPGRTDFERSTGPYYLPDFPRK